MDVASSSSGLSTVTIIDAIVDAEAVLHGAGVTDTPRLDAEILLSGLLEIGRAELIASYSQELEPTKRAEYFSRISRRMRGEPAAYILGEKEFMGFVFHVDDRSLIPRPDTETLVEYVTAAVLEDRCAGKTILDIGAGCGCIAISLALLLPHAAIHATDISEAAIELARQNAMRHHVSQRVLFYAGDLYCAIPDSLKGCIDIIVSNPPYVSEAEYGELDRGIRDFEPALALTGGIDGLDVFRRIADAATEFLVPHGLLAVEIGAKQSEAATEILEGTGKFGDTKVIRDLSGRPRVISGRKAG